MLIGLLLKVLCFDVYFVLKRFTFKNAVRNTLWNN